MRRTYYVTVSTVTRDVGHGPAPVRGGAEQVLRFVWCAGVKVVVTDGSKAYRAAVDRHLGHATHVVDRFHVIGWFAAGLTAVRRDVQRRPDRLDDARRTDLGALAPYRKPALYGQQAGHCAGCATHFQLQHLDVDHIIARARAAPTTPRTSNYSAATATR